MKLVWLVFFCCACGASAPRSEEIEQPRAQLVLVLVYDQLGSSVLESQLDRLDEDGAIRRTIASGHRTNVRYAYAATFTAPGHAAIYSGASPFESGIAANNVWAGERGRVSVMDDGIHPVLGREGAFASPGRMRAPTVADVLEESTNGAAIVASIAMKDRAAILPGGRRPDLCTWFDRRASGFTMSSYYAERLPEWLETFRTDHPHERYLDPVWEPRDPARYAAELGPDEQSGEAAYGFDASFPHDAHGQEDVDAFLSLPRSVEMQIELAERAVQELHMGEDDVPDLLALSIAATDYVGHAFGPDSWEYADALARADAMLGAMIARLERNTRLAVLITSDHGVAPLVERSRERGHEEAARYTSEVELAALRAHVPNGIDGWVQPWVYVGGPDRERTIQQAIAFISARPGIGGAFDGRSGPSMREGSQDTSVYGASMPEDWPGAIFVMPAEWSSANEDLPDGHGTSHGSPWTYDREVPAIYSGPNVDRGAQSSVLAQARVASTIAALLGVDPPQYADREPLPGVRVREAAPSP